MKINRISLINFRNYLSTNVKFNEKMNVFVGDNAQGKTNILESIIILALTKSHRVLNSPNIITFGKTKCKIQGVVKKDKIISKLEVRLTDSEKKLFINSTNIRKVADYISCLNVIIFTPDDLEIVKGSPNIRRNLMNIQLSQISKTYLNTYNEYNKLLKTRNEYLKILFNNNIADKNYLDIITDKLVEKAVIIYQKRKEYIDKINEEINKNFQYISGESGLKIEYLNNIELDSYEEDNIKKRFYEKLKKNYYRELQYGMTMYGPHRDDLLFEFNGNDLKTYGSQGQQKIAILCFKLSEIPIFKEFSGFYPVLLLDDIFSELDIKKRNKLLKLINDLSIQSIITTTDLKNISKKSLEDAFIFEVKNANIERK